MRGLANGISLSTFESQTDRASPHRSESIAGGFTHRIWKFEDVPSVRREHIRDVKDAVAPTAVLRRAAGDPQLIRGELKLPAVLKGRLDLIEPFGLGRTILNFVFGVI